MDDHDPITLAQVLQQAKDIKVIVFRVEDYRVFVNQVPRRRSQQGGCRLQGQTSVETGPSASSGAALVHFTSGVEGQLNHVILLQAHIFLERLHPPLCHPE